MFVFNVIFAFVPPVHWGGGWPAFTVALTFIGLVTMVVGDAAVLFGCALGIPQAVTGITLVALGTSLPDTFASTENLQKNFNYKPSTSVLDGVTKFVSWYKDYYQL